MNPTFLFRFAGYLLCAYLVVVPITEGVLALFPLDLGLVSWRFTAVGLLTQTFMTPMLGLTLAGALAVQGGNRRVLLLLAVVLGGVACVMLPLGGLYAADALAVRQLVPGDRETAILSSAALASLKIGATFLWATAGALGAIGFLRAGTPAKEDAGVVFRRGRQNEPE